MFDVLSTGLKDQRDSRDGEAVVRAVVDQLAAGASTKRYTNRSVQRAMGICAKRFGQKVKAEASRISHEPPSCAESLRPAKKRRSDAFPLDV
jgi:hypothetical protein